jgi:TRAP-type C4-dicarboxylate transport system permease small subunit
MLKKISIFESALRRIGRWLNWVALAALAAMLGLITVDIIGAKVFRLPLLGAMDMVSLLGLVVIAFSATKTQIEKRHIEVDFVATRLNASLQKVLACIKNLVCSLLLAVMIGACFKYGYSLTITGEVSPSIRIPLGPFACAIAIAFLPMLFVFLITLYQTLREIRDR